MLCGTGQNEESPNERSPELCALDSDCSKNGYSCVLGMCEYTWWDNK